MRTKRTTIWGVMTVLTLVSLTIANLMIPSADQTALAVGGSYAINFSAADPKVYIPPIPYPVTVSPIVGRGDGDTAIPDAWFQAPGGSDVKVESLAPENMALGQIVPFEIKISVSGTTEPEDGAITFVADWSTVTTNGSDFGYDDTYGVYAAFVDTGDGAHVDPGADATVESFSWALAGTMIQGTFNLIGLDDGDVVVVEVWLVLDSTFPNKVVGTVASGLTNAYTATDDTINTGSQTVPLLRAGSFDSVSADLSVTKSDSPDPVVAGTQLTYTLTVTNLDP